MKKAQSIVIILAAISIIMVASAGTYYMVKKTKGDVKKSYLVGETLKVDKHTLKVNSVKIVDSDTCVDTTLRDVIVNVDYEPGLDNLYAKLVKDNGEAVPDAAEHGNQSDGMHFKFNVTNTGVQIEERSYKLQLINGMEVKLMPYQYEPQPIPNKEAFCSEGADMLRRFENSR
jgi:hypothetical protein